jgi:hypothetical protein
MWNIVCTYINLLTDTRVGICSKKENRNSQTGGADFHYFVFKKSGSVTESATVMKEINLHFAENQLVQNTKNS